MFDAVVANPREQKFSDFGIKEIADFNYTCLEEANPILSGDYRALISSKKAPELTSLYSYMLQTEFSYYQSHIPARQLTDHFVSHQEHLKRVMPRELHSEISELYDFFTKMGYFLNDLRQPNFFAFELLKVAKENSIVDAHFDSIFTKDDSRSFTPGDKPKIKIVCTLHGDKATLFSPVSNVSGDLEFLRKESERFPNYVNKVYLLDRNLFYEFPIRQPAMWQGGIDGIPHFSPTTQGRIFFGLQAW